jgi:hypothetical protein
MPVNAWRVNDSMFAPKPLLWQRMYVAAVVEEKLAQPTIDWLWERHNPDSGKREIVTNASITGSDTPGVPVLHFIMEYTARGANKTDFRRKVWEAMTMAAGTTQVMARVEIIQVATIRLDLGD